MLEDEYDLFIENAKKVAELHEQGYDVREMAADLVKQANSIDPSTIPSTLDGCNPLLLSQKIEEISRRESPSVSPVVRRRTDSRISDNLNMNTNDNKPAYEISPPANSNENTCSRFLLHVFIVVLILCVIYYLQLPPPCPGPVW
ncbi:unnamed protein product [Caenorhabditis sp. 36 PRJEB53466]|nr:unnamed protein product [Caenorhabditis sp. 36 PRJEB53466]